MTWTNFFDMASGGTEKLDFTNIWIEAPESEAVPIFIEVFGIDPDNVTCSCCGRDYSYSETENVKIEDGDAVVSAEDIRKLRASLIHWD